MEERIRKKDSLERKRVKIVKTVMPNNENRKKTLYRRLKLRNIKLSIMGILSIAMIFTLLSRYSKVSLLSNRSFELDNEIKSLQAERDFLITEIEPYKATDRIESLAKIRLGMDYPRTDQYVSVDTDFKEHELAEEKPEKSYGLLSSILNFFR